MSQPKSGRAAFENSTAACEAMPTAVETRSEFRYRIEAAAPQVIQTGRLRPVIPTSPIVCHRSPKAAGCQSKVAWMR
jgi:hypothetical protein